MGSIYLCRHTVGMGGVGSIYLCRYGRGWLLYTYMYAGIYKGVGLYL